MITAHVILTIPNCSANDAKNIALMAINELRDSRCDPEYINCRYPEPHTREFRLAKRAEINERHHRIGNMEFNTFETHS